MDWLEKFSCYQHIKEIHDYIDDVRKLQYLYQSMQYAEMQCHIGYLMYKYPVETIAWNTANTAAPQTYEQMYQNAEAFLQAVGIKLLTEKTKF